MIGFIAFMAVVFFLLTWIIGRIIAIIGGDTANFYVYVDALIYYLAQGMDIVTLFFPSKLYMIFVTYSVYGWGIKFVYKIAIWIIKKIPVFGIK